MLDTYIDSVLPPSDPLMLRLEEQARATGVPIVGRRTAALVHLLVRVAQPDLIVELGTATGYSGIWLLRGWPQSHLITFEMDEERAVQARRNFAEAGLAERADVRVENAIEGMERLQTGPLKAQCKLGGIDRSSCVKSFGARVVTGRQW
jgi:predicted O-methyltransferase YrrM